MKNKKVNTVQTPVYRDAGFFLKDIKTTQSAFEEELYHYRCPDLYIYSRYRNPTVAAAETALSHVEGSQWALLTQSGMAAIDTALSIFQKAQVTGKWLFFSEIYGGTNSYIDNILIARRGIKVERFYAKDGGYDLNEFSRLIKQHKPEVVYFEAVSNPMLVVADAKEIIRIAKKHRAFVLIDNTFATPNLWKPLQDNADLVIHSATKYLAGHGNITAGAICGNHPELEKLCIEYRKFVGHNLSPDDAARLKTQLKTFDLRVRKQNENALQLARQLEKHPKIEKVRYPGLESHQSYAQALKLFADRGFGAMITFDIKAHHKRAALEKFIKNVSPQIPLIPSLGDVQTTLLPVEAVWGEKYPMPGTVRFSVGIEDYQRLEKIVFEALEHI